MIISIIFCPVLSFPVFFSLQDMKLHNVKNVRNENGVNV